MPRSRTKKPPSARKLAHARQLATFYRVWCPGSDPDGDYAKEYNAIDTRAAARLYAQEWHGRDAARSWPIVFFVQQRTLTPDDSTPTGPTLLVEVRQEMVPEFIPGDPLPLVMDPMRHLLSVGSVLCDDPRLRASKSWPTGQDWTSWNAAVETSAGQLEVILETISCKQCKRRGTHMLNGLRAIGAVK